MIDYARISKLLRDAAFPWPLMTAERAVMLVEKMIYFAEFGYLNSSRVRVSITLMFLSSASDKYTLLQQNTLKDISVGLRPPCWCPSGWAPT